MLNIEEEEEEEEEAISHSRALGPRGYLSKGYGRSRIHAPLRKLSANQESLMSVRDLNFPFECACPSLLSSQSPPLVLQFAASIPGSTLPEIRP